MIVRRAAAALLLAALLAPLLGSAAAAHPLGNFTVNRYSRIEVARGEVRVRYVLDLAEIPTLQELNGAGLGADAPAEAVRARLLAEKAAQLAAGAHLLLAGRAVTWSVREASLELLDGQAGLRTLRVALWLVDDGRVPDGAALEYRDANYPGRAGWHEIVLRGLSGVALADASAPARDASDELRAYPADPSAAPLDISDARATVRYGTSEAVAVAGRADGARLAVGGGVEALTAFLRSGPTDALALAAALAVAASLGALHAFGPGHGKALVGAYLIGSRGTPAHALILGATVTATHTAGVYALGIVTLVAAQHVLPERLYPVLGVTSGLLVVAIGVSLARSRLRALRGSEPAHDDARAHPHPYGRPHDHRGPAHGTDDRAHHAPPPPLRSLIGLGVSGGLLPCPTALVVLLAAVSFHNVLLGMALVAAFSVGLAAVLTALGLLLVLGGRAVARSRALGGALSSRAGRVVPLLSAAAIALAGAVIAFDAARAIG
ncbi:MAG: nickel/cobalt transporter [Candidatus Limnocylindria bacterium]